MFDIIVGTIIFDKNNNVLLVKEKSQENKGLLNLPAGHLEKNESLVNGAKREFKEETGLEVKITSLVDFQTFQHKNTNYLSFIFKGELLNTAKSNSELECSFYSLDYIYKNPEILRNKNLILSAINNAKNNLYYLDILN